MKNINLLVAIGVLLFSACNQGEKDKEQPDENTLGCVTGKITIYNTGSVIDAYVRFSLTKEGEAIYSELIDSDGDYTIDNVEEGTYFFRVYKQGFVDTLFIETISVQPKVQNGGYCRQMDWAITKLPPHLYVVEVNTENVINTLDFGNTEDRLHFQIYNNSENTYTWWSDFEDVKSTKKWLNSMTIPSSSLVPKETKNITITIDRTQLESGPNTAKILIDSDKGGGWVLSIIATH